MIKFAKKKLFATIVHENAAACRWRLVVCLSLRILNVCYVNNMSFKVCILCNEESGDLLVVGEIGIKTKNRQNVQDLMIHLKSVVFFVAFHCSAEQLLKNKFTS